MVFDSDVVTVGLARLRQFDPQGQLVFGATGHRYRLGRTLDEVAVRAFEVQHGIVLPPDYREFLLRAGNGGAGPYYGVFRLGEADDGHGHAVWQAGTFVGDPGKPFPHRDAWNLSDAEIEGLRSNEDDEQILARYWVPVDGAIPICHEGCALRVWLVVTGSEAGHVWRDATADFEGWSPILDSTRARATFGSWYSDWLTGTLGKVSSR